MGEAELVEYEQISAFSGILAIAFHSLVFGSVVAMLARLRDRLAKGPNSRAAAWTLFVALALIAYGVTAVPAWSLDEHLIFWKTGTYSICHLTGVVAKVVPLLVGLVVAAIDRPWRPRVSFVGGLALAAAGAGFLVLAGYRWVTFAVPARTSNDLLIGPLRFTLLPVVGAAAVVVVAGWLIVQHPKTPSPAN